MLAALLGMVLGGLTAGVVTVATEADIGSMLAALTTEPPADGPSTGDSGPALAGPPVSAEWTQPGSQVTTTTSPEPRQTTTTTTTRPPHPTTTTRTTQFHLTTRPDITTVPPTTVPPTSLAMTTRVVRLVNGARADHGCAAVAVDARIERAARKHSADMAERDYFSHDTPEGVGFEERIRDEGYPRPGGENIAKGYRGAADVMAAWMDSDGHRANILNCDLTTIGVGLDTDGWLWTQDFGY